MLTMQDALKKLSDYWVSRGAMVSQPLNTEVGAGTMNPATLLRVLGPEPWNVAYVEPSVRPDDSRYGENPNRLQTHTQFQVILKPEPGNPQELYLGSLEAIGIDTSAHDVRFVEDNWAQPAIGAWGLGWEVWLDGTEITQFTYFQQVGGINLDPIPVELTYGMERIMMAVQGVSHFKDIAYAPGISYGEAFGQAEYEMSRYYLDEADTDRTRALYDAYVEEAKALLEARLPVPAHGYIMKSSHAFNILDARGAISTTQRAQAFATMRGLAREVATLWVARREELEHPLGVCAAREKATASDAPELPTLATPQTLALEIGVEELPAHVVPEARSQVAEAVTKVFSSGALAHGEITCDATPRRIIVTIDDVAAFEPDQTMQRKGPKWSAAFDDEGNPTRPLQGFLKGQGASVDDVTKVVFGKHEHVCLNQVVPGRTVYDVAAEALTEAVGSLRASKNMSWNDSELSYSRAIRYLLALWGEEVVPCAVSTLAAGRVTRVHRTDAQPEREVASADALRTVLRDAGIDVSISSRRASTLQQAEELAKGVGGVIDAEEDSALLDEIACLTEEPRGVLGTFDGQYLALPSRIVTEVMKKHQRYIPVRSADGGLLPHFVTMANGPHDADVVARGNNAVVKARYEDALFFYNADLKETLGSFHEGLESLTFETKLGSMRARAQRIAGVATSLSSTLSVEGNVASTIRRAAEIAKFDLSTSMVVEMSSLAGYMAREYALKAGETPEVADALYGMEQPQTASGELPSTSAGAVLAIADRADLLVSLFSLGAKPTGSSDPFALRRAAIGLARLLRAEPAVASLRIDDVLTAAKSVLEAAGHTVPEGTVEDASDFVQGRFAQLLRDEGISSELVDVAAPSLAAPAAMARALEDVQASAAVESFAPLVESLVRIERIMPEGTTPALMTDALTEPAEVALVEALGSVNVSDGPSTSLPDFAARFDSMVPVVTRFFEEVLVMADDEAVRAARLGMLATIRSLAPVGVDFAALDTWLKVENK